MREHPALRSLRLVSRNGSENGLPTSSVVDLTWLCDLELDRNPLWASGFLTTCPLQTTPATQSLNYSKPVRERGRLGERG